MRNKIIELYNQGYYIWQIAQMCGCSEAYVVRVIRPNE